MMHTQNIRRPVVIWTACILAAMAGAVPASGADEKPDQKPRLDRGGLSGGGTASIKGTVKFEGRQVSQKTIRMTADPFCARHHADAPPKSERYVFGKNDTLQNVLVYVSKGLEGRQFDPPAEPRSVDQIGCIYVPHVQAVMAGQTLAIHSSDNTSHNVKMISKKNGTFNLQMPPMSKQSKTFAREEIGTMMVKCDVHPWMSARVHVLPHPYYAITQADGTFQITGLPPGDYEVSVVHEFDKFKPAQSVIPVSLEDGQCKDITFTYKPPAPRNKPKAAR